MKVKLLSGFACALAMNCGYAKASTELSWTDSLRKTLKSQYVVQDKGEYAAQQLSKLIQSNPELLKTHHSELAKTLTEKLQLWTNDKHLFVEYSPEELPENAFSTKEHTFSSEGEKSMWASKNMGFDEVKRLPFNLGYLRLSAFAPIEHAGPKLAATFELLQHTDAMIIDLRGNFGGYEYTGNLLASYFLNERTLLFTMEYREENQFEQRWSYMNIEGPRYGEQKPLFILVDKQTFSAGEAFAYTMKHLKRATVIGETTFGAGNAGKEVRLSEHFFAFIPQRKMVNPITGSNFNNIGVIPDIKSDDSLVAAQLNYLSKLKTKEPDTRRIKRIDMRISQLKEGKVEL